MSGTNQGRPTLNSLALARHIADNFAGKHGEDILLLDIRDVSMLADYFVIGSVTSERHARTIVASIKETTRDELDAMPLNTEGEPGAGWLLLDYGSVIVHLFAPSARSYYDLEGLWRGGRTVVRLL